MKSLSQTGMVALALASVIWVRDSAKPRVQIVEPKNGATVEGPNVKVVLEATDIVIAPASEQKAGTAHHHLFLDRDPSPPADTIPQGVTGIIHLGRAQTEFLFEGLSKGEHRVVAVLADPWHVPVKDAGTATVRFTVK